MEGISLKNEGFGINKDIIYGILVLMALIICRNLLVSHFGSPAGLSTEQYVQYTNRQFLLMAIPAAVLTFVTTALLRTKTKEAALQNSITWTLMVAVFYIITSLADDKFGLLFTNRGIYALLLSVFIGPVLYAQVRRLEGSFLE